MARKVSPQTLALKNAEEQINEILKKLTPIKLLDGEVYIVDELFYKKLLDIELTLSEYKTDTRRGKAYSIESFIKIINPDTVAFKYHLTIASKSVLITDKGKILDRLEAEKEISKNKILKYAKDKIENEEIEGIAAENIINEANKKIDDEETEFLNIKANPGMYDLIISTFKEKKQYPQINWSYFEADGTQKKTNKHVSIEKPSILIYDDENAGDSYRTDMKVARFIREGYRAVGNVYIKVKDEYKEK